jgi:hypothetical protein
VVFAQQRYYVLRVGAFGEPGEAAQVAEERGNLPAMNAYFGAEARERVTRIGYGTAGGPGR